ncbi:MAG: Cyclic pyranopterin monophosphate synthase accessory protein, partial [uncultured Nocardioides sp.]
GRSAHPRRRVRRGPHGRRLGQGGHRTHGDRVGPGAGLSRGRRAAPRSRGPQGRHPRRGAAGRHHGRQADAVADPAVPPAGPLLGSGRPHRHRRVRRHRRDRVHHRPHRCRDGGAHCGLRRRPHGRRHGQGGRQGSGDHRRAGRDQDRWQERELVAV